MSGLIRASATMACAAACHETLPRARRSVFAGSEVSHRCSVETIAALSPHAGTSRFAARRRTGHALSASAVSSAAQSSFWDASARKRSRHAGSAHSFGGCRTGRESRAENWGSRIRWSALHAMTRIRSLPCCMPVRIATSLESRRSSARSMRPTSAESAEVSDSCEMAMPGPSIAPSNAMKLVRDINRDVTPLALVEADDAECASRSVTEEYRKPDVHWVEGEQLLHYEADAKRHNDLRNDRDV
jgi:hypothetical protein